MATEKPCVIDVSRGGAKGGVILYPLLGIRHAEQCRRTYRNFVLGFRLPNRNAAGTCCAMACCLEVLFVTNWLMRTRCLGDVYLAPKGMENTENASAI